MNYKEILMEKINNLVSGNWSMYKFQEEYYQYFLEKVPDDALTTAQMEFFSLVQEKLDWTAEKPDEQDRKYGYFDHQSYVEWLKKNLEEFKTDENRWYENLIKSFKK